MGSLHQGMRGEKDVALGGVDGKSKKWRVVGLLAVLGVGFISWMLWPRELSQTVGVSEGQGVVALQVEAFFAGPRHETRIVESPEEIEDLLSLVGEQYVRREFLTPAVRYGPVPTNEDQPWHIELTLQWSEPVQRTMALPHTRIQLSKGSTRTAVVIDGSAYVFLGEGAGWMRSIWQAVKR